MSEPGKCMFVANGQHQAKHVGRSCRRLASTACVAVSSLTNTHGLTLDALSIDSQTTRMMGLPSESRLCMPNLGQPVGVVR